MEPIEVRVKKIVAEQLGVNETDIKSESKFVDDLGADSLDTVESSSVKFPMRKRRRLPPCNRLSITSIPT